MPQIYSLLSRDGSSEERNEGEIFLLVDEDGLFEK